MVGFVVPKEHVESIKNILYKKTFNSKGVYGEKINSFFVWSHPAIVR